MKDAHIYEKSVILSLISVLFLIAAILFTFSPSNRYGFHTDTLPCGKNPTHQTFYVATTYMLFTRPTDRGATLTGTCPYQTFSSSTFALDLWLPGILFGYLGYKSLRTSKRTQDKTKLKS